MHSSVNWALLGLIIERPSHAYELARRFERTYEGALALSSISHIYAALARLSELGLIEDEPPADSPQQPKRRYRATETGLAEHTGWLIGQVSEERRRQRVLMIQLGALAKAPGQAMAALDAYEQACMSEIAAAPAPGADEGPGTTHLVARLIGEETRQTVAARLRWVQYARAQLHTLAGATPYPQAPQG